MTLSYHEHHLRQLVSGFALCVEQAVAWASGWFHRAFHHAFLHALAGVLLIAAAAATVSL
jgi:hypothetical protein